MVTLLSVQANEKGEKAVESLVNTSREDGSK